MSDRQAKNIVSDNLDQKKKDAIENDRKIIASNKTKVSLKAEFSRKWLLSHELKLIFDCAKQKSLSDYALLLLSYRHGLRSKECTLLQYSWIDSVRSQIWIERLKGSISSMHPLARDEMKLIRKLKSESKTDFLFPIDTARIRQICRAISLETDISFNHHQLRHTCGYDMAIKGIDSLIIKNYFGHKNIQNTMIYINGAGRQFDKLPVWYQ